MISFCNYSFCMGKDVLNPFPTNTENINNVEIRNGIYDHINITRDTDFPYNKNLPEWDVNTVINCDFENSISAGNVDFTISQLSSIKIKRRKKGSFEWITIRDIPINSKADLTTIIKDYFVPSYEDFEYAVVPILNGVEGTYIINGISTEFNGVFISDITNTFKLYNSVSYNGVSSVQEVGQVTPLGRRYPVIIKNGEADYDSGSISALILNEDYEKTHIIDRKKTVERREEFLSFLKNGKPKIIKDWNSQIWIASIVGKPSVNYNNNYGMGIANVNFEWVEQGKYDNEDDLYNNGLIEITI